MNWTEQELGKIADSDDLHISPFRDDGSTCGTPTWIWSVVVDGDLYVRAYNEHNSRWYRAAMKQRAGRVQVAGMTREVAFEPADSAVNAAVDAAYRGKYRNSRYLGSMIGEQASSATVRIIPSDG